MRHPTEILGQNVIRAREKLEWTQEELAHRSGVPRRTIQNIEADKVSPRLDTILAMSRALQITLGELVGQDEYAKRRVAESIVKAERSKAWADSGRILAALAEAGPVKRAVVLYLLLKDADALNELPPTLRPTLRLLHKV